MDKKLFSLCCLVSMFLLDLVGCQANNILPSTIITQTPETIPASTATITLAPTSTSLPFSTPTFIQTVTQTLTITPSITPKPTSFGGGGLLVMTLNKDLYSPAFNLPGESNLFLAKPDGSDLAPLTKGEDDMFISFEDISPDKNQILYSAITGDAWTISTSGRRGSIYTVDVSESTPIKLNDKTTTVYPDASRWLTDGRIVFIGVNLVDRAVYIVNSDGTGMSRLKNTAGEVTGIAKILFFSQDGSGIYWVTGVRCVSRGICNEKYYYTQLDGSVHKQVWKDIQSAADNISISPEGNTIAFFTFFGGDPVSRPRNACFLANIDGSKIRQIDTSDCQFRGNIYHQRAAWSPNGDYLVYSTSKNTGLNLYLVSDEKSIKFPKSIPDYCSEATWFTNSERVILSRCLAPNEKSDKGIIQFPAYMVDLNTSAITMLPGSESCKIAPSPDEQELWYYNCFEPKESSAIFSILDLQTLQIHPIFDELKLLDPTVAFVIENFLQSRWIR